MRISRPNYSCSSKCSTQFLAIFENLWYGNAYFRSKSCGFGGPKFRDFTTNLVVKPDFQNFANLTPPTFLSPISDHFPRERPRFTDDIAARSSRPARCPRPFSTADSQPRAHIQQLRLLVSQAFIIHTSKSTSRTSTATPALTGASFIYNTPRLVLLELLHSERNLPRGEQEYQAWCIINVI